MTKFSTEGNCPKCAFTPSYTMKWEYLYKDKCYTATNCGWDDKEVDEHLHQICPACGYSVAVPCADYDEKKGNTWSVSDEDSAAPSQTALAPIRTFTPPNRRHAVGTGHVAPVTPITQPVRTGWGVPCTGCVQEK